VATACFDGDGHVDVKKLKVWMDFFGNAENFKEEPFCLIPHAELMRSQMHRVCECLISNQNGARAWLDAAADITVGQHGRSILDTISKGRETPLNPGEAILASLFTPHRQFSLPTCTINSLLNEEIRNHLERLIEIYVQMLRDSQITFPSGYAVLQQSVEDGFIPANLVKGGIGRSRLFWNVTSSGPAEADQQIEAWKREGIVYDKAKTYELKMPIRNMNDVLLTYLSLESNFGNWKIDNDSELGTMLVYFGHREKVKVYPAEIQVGGSAFLTGIAELKEQAKAQQLLGHSYMRVSTLSSIGPHAENIDIDALLTFDPHAMKTGECYPIGDRNWIDHSMLRDIPHLAVRKVDDTPTFEFGTLYGSIFQKEYTTAFWVYGVDVEVHNAHYWEQFRP
ncbi:MAG: hypothetical protein LBI47_02845, partial [Puniceicoccales bacterium]|jgi:hypothetical protein|nr:hypothetical protein [Puniceicoccales bacterium]